MSSHYLMIGFPLEFDDDYWPLRAVGDGEEMAVDAGSYRVLRSGSGAELWASVSRRGWMFEPHFAGGARCPLLLVGRLRGESRFQGSFEAVGASATPQDPEVPERFGFERNAVAREHLLGALDAAGGARARRRSVRVLARLGRGPTMLDELRRYDTDDVATMEVVFDAPDARLHKDLTLPTVADVQLAAFAQDCSWYAGEADFFAWLESQDLEPFRDAFIMHRHIDPSDEMRAVASISATVLDTAEHVNELTGLSFRWARVGTAVGELDVVADVAIESGQPVVGGLVYGRVWLSGRIVAHDTSRPT
jgi:hypothetical protein